MKNLMFAIVTSLNLMNISLIILLSFVRYEIDKLDGTYNLDMYSYILFPLVALVVMLYVVEIYLIYFKFNEIEPWGRR